MSGFLTERTGVISDIHGNSPALRAVLKDIRQNRCDHLVVLGDIINGVDPQECVDQLRTWDEKVCIRGNAESYILTPDLEHLPEDQDFSSTALIELVEWFRSKLNQESLK